MMEAEYNYALEEKLDSTNGSAFQIAFRQEMVSSFSPLEVYNKDVASLQFFLDKHHSNNKASLQFLTGPDVLNILAEKHYNNNQPPQVQINRFMTLVFNLKQLAEVIDGLNDTVQQAVFFDVLFNSINLARILVERYNHYRLQPSDSKAHDYEDAFEKLSEIIQTTESMVQNVDAPTMNSFIDSINQLQNLIEAPSERFLREHPHTTAFIAAALVAVGTCLVAGGVFLLPVISTFIAAVATSTICLGALVASLGISLLITQGIEQLFLRNQAETDLIEQTSKTVCSIKSLTQSSVGLFAPEPRRKSILPVISSENPQLTPSLSTYR